MSVSSSVYLFERPLARLLINVWMNISEVSITDLYASDIAAID